MMSGQKSTEQAQGQTAAQLSQDAALTKLLIKSNVRPAHLSLCFDYLLHQRGGKVSDRQIIFELLEGGIQSEDLKAVFEFLITVGD